MSANSPEPFMPRPEFIRDQKSTPNTFALLTISGPNCIRLYSFTSEVIATLRRFLEQRVVVQGLREDTANKLYEFALEGKPWSSPKSLATERFLIDLLAVLYRCGYTYLSTIDYGREPDDRLAIALSCPSTPPEVHSPIPQGSGSTLSEKQRQYRVPFAISFTSSTVLRVIQPPLHSTPAILQAVRSSWPRGVESEKKVGDNCFEFKLKGYKWFQEDTFAADSLRHILSLLASLDSHSFTLQTSISLTNRSRVKDLWIFTGPLSSAPDDAFPTSSSPSLFNSSQTALKRAIPTPEPVPSPSHKRLATDPLPPHDTIPVSPVRGVHHRAVTAEPRAGSHSPRTGTPPPHSPASSGSNVLRKAAPRAQIPVSVHDGDLPDGMEYRTILPSVVPEGVPNMTGVGATPDVFYATSPFGSAENGPPTPSNQPPSGTPPHHSPTRTPPLAHSPPYTTSPTSNTENTENAPSTPGDEHGDPSNRDTGNSLSGPLLSPGAFRDSAFSSSTEMSKEIPIKWTGGLETLVAGDNDPRPGAERMSSAGPMLPGGWQATPIEEEEKEIPPRSSTPENEMPDLKQDVRVASPEISEPTGQGIRSSEAALMGVIPNEAPPPVPPLNTDDAKEKQRTESSGSGQGWVLVNVEGKNQPTSPLAESSKHEGQESESSAATDPKEVNGQANNPVSHNASMSPAAKAIVIIDAVDAKSKPKKEPPSTSRVRRFFSLSRKDSPKIGENPSQDPGTGSTRVRSRSGLGQRLRRIGTPEATRNEDNRRSFD
ncbi:hypothetical protein V5O48_001722 [Marasmius crinis-equi]|uniref:Uncharacterized protein n=1 Tax=Marasmius crinis-equi TaxID=585013 RepID=A0ABR3FXN2_9AGAR